MAGVTVIGYGNPLRGDDGLGWLVAARLCERVASDETDPDVQVLALHQLTPELAEAISGSKLVVFVDASCEQAPGHLLCKVLAPRPGAPGATTHHLDPAGLLAFTRELYGACPTTALLLTVGGESFGYEEGLSPTVAARLPLLERILASCVEKTSPTPLV